MTSVAALRPRPDRSFERFYRRHAGDLYRFALALAGDPHEAETITQDAFASAYRALREGDRPGRAEPWLAGLVLDMCREREEPRIVPSEAEGGEETDDGSLVCREAELAISRVLDGLLARHELEALRIHLAWCGDCAAFACDQRAHRAALKVLGRVPLSPALAAWTTADSAAVAGPM
jgi:DNA-directed RNA polymerase specialized sigma24 family protein